LALAIKYRDFTVNETLDRCKSLLSINTDTFVSALAILDKLDNVENYWWNVKVCCEREQGSVNI